MINPLGLRRSDTFFCPKSVASMWWCQPRAWHCHSKFSTVTPGVRVVIPGLTRDPAIRIHANYFFVFFIPVPRIECGVTKKCHRHPGLEDCHPGLDPGSSHKNPRQLFFVFFIPGPRIECGVTGMWFTFCWLTLILNYFLNVIPWKFAVFPFGSTKISSSGVLLVPTKFVFTDGSAWYFVLPMVM